MWWRTRCLPSSRSSSSSLVSTGTMASLSKTAALAEGGIRRMSFIRSLEPTITPTGQRAEMSVSIAQELNSDILFMIFTDIAFANSLYMLRISAVCRRWYNVALSTPQAWARISMDTSSKPEYMETYLARSGSAPLHISMNEGITDSNWGLLVEQKRRIRCLKIRGCYRFLQLSTFPILEKLTLRAHTEKTKNDILEPHVSKSLLEISRFPRLRSVEMLKIPGSLRRAIIKPPEGFPQLQKLSTTLERDTLGYQIIIGTVEMLVSLTLYIRGGSDLRTIQLPLPRLRHFGILDCNRESKTTIEIAAPRLESVQYLIAHRQSTVLTGDIHKAKHLLTNSLNAMSQYPNIRILWLEDKATDFWVNGTSGPTRYTVVSALASKIPYCPKLENICIRDVFSWNTSLNVLQSALEGTGISLSFTKWPHPRLPGSTPGNLTDFCEC